MSSLTPISELLTRSLEHFSKDPLLVINPPADNLHYEMSQLGISAQFFTTDLVTHEYLEGIGANSFFADSPERIDKTDWSQVIFCWPKAKAHAELLLKQTINCMSNDAELWLTGENRGGINSAPKLLKGMELPSQKVDSARRCSLFFSHLTGNHAAPESDFSYFKVNFMHRCFKCASVPGVFNHGKLDEGTKLLLKTIEQTSPYSGRAFDVGCGAGVITAALSFHSPELELSCGDVNAMAVLASKQTMQHNNAKAQVVASNLIKGVEGQFDLVISNPPFHQGLATDYDISSELFKQAHQRLNKKGELRIVANGFLPYSDQIHRIFGNCKVLSENRQFKVYSAIKC
ncbi:methyltransferase [Corallincola platygyrae]|uniref:Ribosomal RNA small subunit methyltransferase C n=1 Tax=Corallincola platygyrae TaxID=1193278 RepID=A0ABW4XMT4_9GAMM